MAITAIVGKIGSGKSHKQFSYALEQANLKRKRLVTNFGVNFSEMKRYCAMKKYGWVAHLLETGQFACIDSLDDLTDLLAYPNSICCLDEAGIFLNAREFAKTPKSFLVNLAQSRKDGIDLIYASQFDEQIDKQVRLLTQWFIYADGLSVYDPVLKRPKLKIKKYHYFDADAYFQWNSSPKARSSLLRTAFAAFKNEISPINAADVQLFKCFDSFARLEQQQAAARSMAAFTYQPEDLVQVCRDSLACHAQKYRSYFWGALQVPIK